MVHWDQHQHWFPLGTVTILTCVSVSVSVMHRKPYMCVWVCFAPYVPEGG